MKIKFLTVITSLLAAAFMITSCLDDNEVETEYSSESSITSFAIKDKIETQYTEKVNGKDTTLTFTVDGTKYPFAIDQGTRHIYNVDSLPVGTDISKVVVSIKSDGIGIFIVAEDKDSLWNDTDSLNFEKPVQFKVMAMSGVYGPIYKAEINVHKQVPDSLQWSHRGSSFDNTIQAQKAVTLGDYIYVFAQQDNGAAVTSRFRSLARIRGLVHAPLLQAPTSMTEKPGRPYRLYLKICKMRTILLSWHGETNYTYLPTMTCTAPLTEKAGARWALTPNSRS